MGTILLVAALACGADDGSAAEAPSTFDTAPVVAVSAPPIPATTTPPTAAPASSGPTPTTPPATLPETVPATSQKSIDNPYKKGLFGGLRGQFFSRPAAAPPAASQKSPEAAPAVVQTKAEQPPSPKPDAASTPQGARDDKSRGFFAGWTTGNRKPTAWTGN